MTNTESGVPSEQLAKNRSTQRIRCGPEIAGQLLAAHRTLIAQAFPDDEIVYVRRIFFSGYSGAIVLLVSTSANHPPTVVKIAPPNDLTREYDAYQQHVSKISPQDIAHVRNAPLIAEDGQLGLIQYTFVGGNAASPALSLYDYYLGNGAAATAEVLNRVFRVFGRHWWANNRPHIYALGEQYDRLLTSHLQVVRSLPTGVPQVLEAGQSSARTFRALEVGQTLQLLGFTVEKVQAGGTKLTLRGSAPLHEATAPLRIRVESSEPLSCQPGDQIAQLDGIVIATRQTLLNTLARTTMASYRQDEKYLTGPFTEDVQRRHGIQLLNPLYQFDTILDHVMETRFSVIHGDLNLQNVLVDNETGFAWLIDFAETRLGPTVFDLQRLEVQVITKLLPSALLESGLEAETVVDLMVALHRDPPQQNAPHTELAEPYMLLATLRRLARQYLVDDLEWGEYYLGLLLALVGALKYDELDNVARRLLLLAAATVYGLVGEPLRVSQSESGREATPQQPTWPAPEPTRPPEISGFIGRDRELTYFADKLVTQRLAIISGMAGVGKTALAATLTRWVVDNPEKIFWHSFREGEGIEVVIWQLAGFLAWQGQSDLWQLLQSTRQTGGLPPPTDTLFNFLLQLLRRGHYLLCFDDVHFIDDDSLLNQLVERLLNALPSSDFSLIITTRRLPEFVQRAGFNPLDGLSIADTRQLVMRHGILLNESQCDKLHTYTAGNAVFLTLALDVLQQAKDAEELITHLAKTDDIERYLLTEVDEMLTGQERNVMIAIACLLAYTGTREAIEAIVNAGNLWRVLRRLHERHMLVVQESALGREYGQHAILQAFYYDLVSPRQRRQLHRRAGDFYVEIESQPLRAGLHYERADEYTLAAQQATLDVWTLINQGQTRVLSGLLERFDYKQLETELWVKVNLARGLSYMLLNERELARQSYKEALSSVDGITVASARHELTARSYQGMAKLLELEDPQESLSWLQRGLAELADSDGLERATLQIEIGAAQMYLGNYGDGLQTLETGLRRLPGGPSQLRSVALKNLGSIYAYQGNFERAQDYAKQALKINQQLHDLFEMAQILVNLGFLQDMLGNWPGAIANYQKAIELATQLGSAQLQAPAELNLGVIYVMTGEDELAFKHLQNSLELAQTNALHIIAIITRLNLADLQIRLGQVSAAEILLQRAEEQAIAIHHKGSLIAIYKGWADLELAKNNSPSALERVQQSIALARELEEVIDEGTGLRTLGQVWLMHDQYQKALEAFTQSLACLENKAPYEAARTKLELGKALLANQERERGKLLIQEVQSTFVRLGALRDQAIAEEILANADR